MTVCKETVKKNIFELIRGENPVRVAWLWKICLTKVAIRMLFFDTHVPSEFRGVSGSPVFFKFIVVSLVQRKAFTHSNSSLRTKER